MEYGYPVTAFSHDAGRGLWSLDHDFDAATMLWQIRHDEAGAHLIDALGKTVATGVMTADIPLLLSKPAGGTLRLDRIEIDGKLMLFLPSDLLEAGVDYRETSALAGTARPARPEEIALLPALGTGVMIATDEGPQPIDWLRPGDRVLTRDNGYQPLLWLGQHVVPRRSPPETRPLRITAGAFGEALPERDMVLSPGTGILLAGHELDLWFGETEMLSRAADLVIRAEPLEGKRPLYTLLFAAPEVVLAEGMWIGSVHADAAFIALLPDRVRSALAPRIGAAHQTPARAWLADWEVAMFRRERIARKRRIAA